MSSDDMVKLTDEGIKWMVKRVSSENFTVKQASRTYGITERRVQQLTKMYRDTGEFPKLNPNRRPKTHLSDEQKAIIDKVWEETRLGARLLFYELKRRGYRIPHNKIHQYLRETGRTTPNPRKQKKRKRCRYERKHSGSLIHGDWHRTTKRHPYAIIWLDDASRMALAGGEFERAAHVESIDTIKEAQDKAHEFNVQIREVNTDRDARFYSNKNPGTSEFEHYLKREGIKHIPSRKGNPQTNGKLERLWLEYDRHRWRFESIEAFLTWYNNRILVRWIISTRRHRKRRSCVDPHQKRFLAGSLKGVIEMGNIENGKRKNIRTQQFSIFYSYSLRFRTYTYPRSNGRTMADFVLG